MSARQPPHAAVSASVGTCPSCGTNLLKGDRFCGGCGAPVPQEAETELLTDLQQVTLGEHEILGVLGRGGMGLVYLAHDISLNRKVAIKVLPSSLLQGEASVERFRREARIAASLRHRHITSVFGLKETTKVVFFVMEYVEGRTLDAILHDEGRLTIDAIAAIMHDTAGALSYAHRREVVHRDLKPANVIIDVEGMAMITDFGVAKVTTSQGLTTAGSTVGSPKYMSPEQWSGKASSMSDQYALGCVAYELLAGRAPFEGETIEELMKQQLFDAPQPVSELRPDCPPALASAVMRMLEKDPSKRWPSLDAAVTETGLRAVAPDDPVRVTLAKFAKRGHDVRALPKTPQSPIPIGKISLRREPVVKRSLGLNRPLLWAGAAGVVVLLAAGAYVAFRGKPAESVAAIEIAKAPPTLAVGDRAVLTGRVKNAAGAVLGSAPITWLTSDSSVASLSGDGTVTALAAGTATLTASSAGKSATVTVTVGPTATDVAALDVVPHDARIAPGATVRLKVVATDRNGNPVTGNAVEWSSHAPRVAAISPTGVVTGVAAGGAVVTATSGGKSASAMVTVVRPGAASLAVRPATVSIAVNQTVRLSAVARDARGNVLSPRGVEWSSSAPRTAVVSSTGDVTGVAPGTARIAVTSEGLIGAPATVTVKGGATVARGVVQMLVTPWAFVVIDGHSMVQRTRGVDTLSAGVPHRIHFERPGFVTFDTTVTLQPDEQRLLRIQMTQRR